jgi:Cupin
VTKFVCGYLSCDPHLSKTFLGWLQPVFKVHIGSDTSGQWLQSSILYSVGQAVDSDTGSEIVVAKLSEALFSETLRRYVNSLAPGETGWLAGARDPAVGSALALLHRLPSQPWTIAKLAAQVGVSRSVLAKLFRHFF